MKTLKQLKTLAIAGMTMGLALGAWAETVDYNLKLQDGKAYTNDVGDAYVFTEGAKKLGLSYDANTDVWTMKNFNFTTTANGALFLPGTSNRTFTVIGNCRIATTSTNGPEVIVSWGNVTFNGAASGVNTLTITSPDDKSGRGEAHGIFFEGDGGLSIGDNVTVTFDVGRDVTAVSSFDALSVFGNGKLIAKTEGGEDVYAFIGSTEPDATAKNTLEGTAPTWVSEEGHWGESTGFYANISGSVTNIATNVTLTEPVKIPATPTEIANTTFKIYKKGVEATDGMVWSNKTATVVYKANAGWYFENGQAEVTNQLDTTKSPAVNAAGEKVPALVEASVQLGVVAQRYPWNGTLDVGYRATFVKDAPATLTVEANGQTYTQEVKISSGTNTVAFTNLPAEIKAKDAKVTLKLK